MKNKITKLFLALLTLSFGYNANAQVEDQPMPDYVRKATNIEFLNNFAKDKEVEFEANYKKAVEIARSQGKSLGGVNEEDGSVSVLKGYDEETGSLIYVKTFGSVKADANMFFNNVAVGSSLQTANAKPLHADNIIGAGMIVGVWDGGAGLTAHQGFAGNRYQPKNNPNNNSYLNKDHAAHVAGTVAANTFGNGDAMGFAYGATVHAYYGLLNDLTSMTAAATSATNPLYVSNHSYGLDFSGGSVSIFGLYDSRARDYDLLMNNAPYYTIVFAAGNDREEGFNPSRGVKDLLSQGGVSKNTVVVAATKGTENFSGITGAASVTSIGGAQPFMAPYSNYGPTDDFRIKPDIAAKGGVMTNNAATTDPVTSVGIKNISDTEVMQGTSMAAPAVTGVFTLWQGYYKTVFNKYMRSASVRALMAHTAREAGPAAGPDFMFGWGLIDADKGRQIIDQSEANTAIFEEIDLPQGSHFDYEFTYDGVGPLVVTVAWNDPAGTVTPSSQVNQNLKKLVNDLDVRLINLDNNTIYYPWSLVHNPGLTHTSTGIAVNNVDNARDNIEKIEPNNNAVAGNYKVEITYKGTLSGGNQNFSIIISGAGGQMPSTEGSVSVASVALETLSVYPNPVNDVLIIQGDLNNLNNGTVDVFDVTGKNVLKSKIVDSQSMSINVSNLKQGMYILTITKDGAKQNYKFLKN